MKWTQCLPQEVATRVKADNICQAYSSASTGSQAPYFPYLICNNCISACVSWILWSFKSSIIYLLRCWCLISLITGQKPDHPTSASAECSVHSRCSIYTYRVRECLRCIHSHRVGSSCFTSLASSAYCPWSCWLVRSAVPLLLQATSANTGQIRTDVRVSLVQIFA